jgi:hypothetical protein
MYKGCLIFPSFIFIFNSQIIWLYKLMNDHKNWPQKTSPPSPIEIPNFLQGADGAILQI